MDHPDAIEYRVRYAARRRSRLRPGHFSFNVLDLTRPWDPETTPDPRRLSDVSRQRARDLWGGQDNDEHIRQLAFDLWLTRCVAEELPALREIDASSPLFRRAILARARLADATCVPALIPEIRKLSWHFRLAPPVWCLELHELADEYLRSFHSQIPSDFTGGRSDDHFALSELLMQIPRDEAEGLIVEHWDHLRYSSLFIQAALFVGTPRCLALADAAIRECPPEIGVLEHVDDHFGVMVVGRQDSVTLEHLERLLPYIDRLDAMSVRMVADFCNRRGRQEWVRRHILPYLAEGHRPDLCPTEADIEREFDRFARDDGRSIQLRFWADEVAGRLVTPGPLIGILQRWIASKGHPTAWRVAAEIIACVGSRSDLGMFEGWPLTGSDEERRVIENTRYRVERRSLG